AAGRRLARDEIDDDAVLEAVVGEFLDPVVAIEADGENLPIDHLWLEKGGLLDGAGDVVVAVALGVYGGRGRGRTEDCLYFDLAHARLDLLHVLAPGQVAAVVDDRAAGQQAGRHDGDGSELHQSADGARRLGVARATH